MKAKDTAEDLGPLRYLFLDKSFFILYNIINTTNLGV